MACSAAASRCSRPAIFACAFSRRSAARGPAFGGGGPLLGFARLAVASLSRPHGLLALARRLLLRLAQLDLELALVAGASAPLRGERLLQLGRCSAAARSASSRRPWLSSEACRSTSTACSQSSRAFLPGLEPLVGGLARHGAPLQLLLERDLGLLLHLADAPLGLDRASGSAWGGTLASSCSSSFTSRSRSTMSLRLALELAVLAGQPLLRASTVRTSTSGARSDISFEPSGVTATTPLCRNRVHVVSPSASTFFASSKSFSVRPPSAWVEIATSTWLQEIAMSGWWFISSAGATTSRRT